LKTFTKRLNEYGGFCPVHLMVAHSGAPFRGSVGTVSRSPPNSAYTSLVTDSWLNFVVRLRP